MAEGFSIHLRLFAARVRAGAQYPGSLVLEMLGGLALSGLDLVVILVLFHHLPTLAGWSFAEVAFLYGSSYVTFKLADVTVGNVDRLPDLIRLGEFDGILTRPLGSLGQVLTQTVDIRHLGGAAQGAVVFAYAVSRVDVVWTPDRVAVTVSALVSGYVIFCGVWVVTNAIAFWTTDAREVANTFTYGGNFVTQLPMPIYGAWLRRLFVFVVPVAFVNYFPALYVLDKPDPLGLPPFARLLSPLVAVGVWIAAGAIWRGSVRRYRSTGS